MTRVSLFILGLGRLLSEGFLRDSPVPVSAVTLMGSLRALGIDVEDSASLRWARAKNRGEERCAAREVKALSRAAAARCSDVKREQVALERVLLKVRTSTGYLSEDTCHQRT